MAPHVAMVTGRRLATNSCSHAHVFFPFIFPPLQLLILGPLPLSPVLFSSSVCLSALARLLVV